MRGVESMAERQVRAVADGDGIGGQYPLCCGSSRPEWRDAFPESTQSGIPSTEFGCQLADIRF